MAKRIQRKRVDCAKCRDVKKWTPAEDVNGDGVMWHWSLWGLSAEDIARGYSTCLAKKCMRKTEVSG